eukprot:gene11019-13033_t
MLNNYLADSETDAPTSLEELGYANPLGELARKLRDNVGTSISAQRGEAYPLSLLRDAALMRRVRRYRLWSVFITLLLYAGTLFLLLNFITPKHVHLETYQFPPTTDLVILRVESGERQFSYSTIIRFEACGMGESQFKNDLVHELTVRAGTRGLPAMAVLLQGVGFVLMEGAAGAGAPLDLSAGLYAFALDAVPVTVHFQNVRYHNVMVMLENGVVELEESVFLDSRPAVNGSAEECGAAEAAVVLEEVFQSAGIDVLGFLEAQLNTSLAGFNSTGGLDNSTGGLDNGTEVCSSVVFLTTGYELWVSDPGLSQSGGDIAISTEQSVTVQYGIVNDVYCFSAPNVTGPLEQCEVSSSTSNVTTTAYNTTGNSTVATNTTTEVTTNSSVCKGIVKLENAVPDSNLTSALVTLVGAGGLYLTVNASSGTGLAAGRNPWTVGLDEEKAAYLSTVQDWINQGGSQDALIRIDLDGPGQDIGEWLLSTSWPYLVTDPSIMGLVSATLLYPRWELGAHLQTARLRTQLVLMPGEVRVSRSSPGRLYPAICPYTGPITEVDSLGVVSDLISGLIGQTPTQHFGMRKSTGGNPRYQYGMNDDRVYVNNRISKSSDGITYLVFLLSIVLGTVGGLATTWVVLKLLLHYQKKKAEELAKMAALERTKHSQDTGPGGGGAMQQRKADAVIMYTDLWKCHTPKQTKVEQAKAAKLAEARKRAKKTGQSAWDLAVGAAHALITGWEDIFEFLRYQLTDSMMVYLQNMAYVDLADSAAQDGDKAGAEGQGLGENDTEETARSQAAPASSVPRVLIKEFSAAYETFCLQFGLRTMVLRDKAVEDVCKQFGVQFVRMTNDSTIMVRKLQWRPTQDMEAAKEQSKDLSKDSSLEAIITEFLQALPFALAPLSLFGRLGLVYCMQSTFDDDYIFLVDLEEWLFDFTDELGLPESERPSLRASAAAQQALLDFGSYISMDEAVWYVEGVIQEDDIPSNIATALEDATSGSGRAPAYKFDSTLCRTTEPTISSRWYLLLTNELSSKMFKGHFLNEIVIVTYTACANMILVMPIPIMTYYEASGDGFLK